MRFGYWTPIYGGFLRNVTDEGMAATWDYISGTAKQADRLGFDLTLIPELYLNDRKGTEAPVLEAWELAAAIAAVTERTEIMLAVRPGFHLPALAAKRAATLDEISGGRLALNVVSAWWADEARQYGGVFSEHDERYVQSEEFVTILDGLWRETPYSYQGKYFSVDGTYLVPKPARKPPIYAGGESEGGRAAIARFADSYVMHGGTVDEIAANITDMQARRDAIGKPPLEEFGMSAYIIVRDTEEEAQRELERITTVDPTSRGYDSYLEFTKHSELSVELSRREYSVGTRGLRPAFVGTAEQVADRIREYQAVGLGLLLIQSSPLHEELDRIAETLIPLLKP